METSPGHGTCFPLFKHYPMHTIVLIIIINLFYSKLSALARVCPRRGNLPKLIWVQYLADLIWSYFSLPNTHAYSANGNHSWLRGGGQAPQLFSSCTREKQEGTTLTPSFLPITASSNSTASKQSQEKPLSGLQAAVRPLVPRQTSILSWSLGRLWV